MIRFIIIVLYLIIVFFISLPLFAIRFIQRKKHPDESAQASQRFVVAAFNIIRILSGAKVIVKGLENVPEEGTVLYVGNHRSFFDIILGYAYVKNNTGFVAKDSLKNVPLIGTWMKLLNCLFLNRDDIKEGLKTILKGVELVKHNTSVFIFPEGTRSEGDELLPFKEGSLKIAEKGKCPVIPVAITNTEQLFEAHMPFVRGAKVVIEFGKPIDLNALDKEAKKHAAAYIRDIIIEMRKSHPSILA